MLAPTPPDPDDRRSDALSDRAYRLVALGYITAVAMPPVGVLVAIVVAKRPTRVGAGHWRWIVLVSLIAAILWTVALASGAATSTSNGFN